jgi:hypothetical protein
MQLTGQVGRAGESGLGSAVSPALPRRLLTIVYVAGARGDTGRGRRAHPMEASMRDEQRLRPTAGTGDASE